MNQRLTLKNIAVLTVAFAAQLALARGPVKGTMPITDVIDDANATKLVEAPLSWGLTEDQATDRIDSAKNMALEIYRSVYPRLSNADERELIATTHDSLKAADVVFPPEGKDFEPCARYRGVIAFVKGNYDGNIYMCSRPAHDELRPVKYLAQVLVHESFHTVGVHDECRTTELEVAVMRASSVGLVFRNGYWGPCGIE